MQAPFFCTVLNVLHQLLLFLSFTQCYCSWTLTIFSSLPTFGILPIVVGCSWRASCHAGWSAAFAMKGSLDIVGMVENRLLYIKKGQHEVGEIFLSNIVGVEKLNNCCGFGIQIQFMTECLALRSCSFPPAFNSLLTGTFMPPRTCFSVACK